MARAIEKEAVFERLVQRIYAAAGDHSAWTELVEAIAAAAGCEAACLVHARTDRAAANIGASVGMDPARALAFDRHYSKINPYIPKLQHLSPGQVCGLDELVEPQVAKESEFYNDYVLPQKHHIAPALGLLFAGPFVSSTLGLFSTSTKTGEVERLIAFQKRFIGHLQCALRLHHQLVALQDQVHDLLTALERRGVAVASVDARGRVGHASAAALSIFARDDGLSYDRGLLRAHAARPVSLQRALSAVTRLAEGRTLDVPAVLRVARRVEGAPDYALVLCPVAERHAALRAEAGRALVFVFDPAQQATLSPRLLFQSYGLTAAEARVAELLAAGEPPQRIAQRLNVSRETVKSHLSMAYAKTGTRGQSELVSALLRGVASLADAPEVLPAAFD